MAPEVIEPRSLDDSIRVMAYRISLIAALLLQPLILCPFSGQRECAVTKECCCGSVCGCSVESNPNPRQNGSNDWPVPRPDDRVSFCVGSSGSRVVAVLELLPTQIVVTQQLRTMLGDDPQAFLCLWLT